MAGLHPALKVPRLGRPGPAQALLADAFIQALGAPALLEAGQDLGAGPLGQAAVPPPDAPAGAAQAQALAGCRLVHWVACYCGGRGGAAVERMAQEGAANELAAGGAGFRRFEGLWPPCWAGRCPSADDEAGCTWRSCSLGDEGLLLRQWLRAVAHMRDITAPDAEGAVHGGQALARHTWTACGPVTSYPKSMTGMPLHCLDQGHPARGGWMPCPSVLPMTQAMTQDRQWSLRFAEGGGAGEPDKLGVGAAGPGAHIREARMAAGTLLLQR